MVLALDFKPKVTFADTRGKRYICKASKHKIMARPTCENCAMRKKYDTQPKSLIGRFWRLHISICPGWKGYFTSLTPEEQQKLRDQYHFTKIYKK